MKTYVTISLSKEDIAELGEETKEDSKMLQAIDNVVYSALTLMIGSKLVQLKVTNLPMREES